VKIFRRLSAAASLAALLAGCATSTPKTPSPENSGKPSAAQKDLKEGRKMMGTENDVRVDAEIYGDRIDSTTVLPVKYTIENRRNTPILVADIVPLTTYDPDTRTITVNVGSEVPGQTLLPRLIQINPTEKKEFTVGAHTNILVAEGATGLLTPLPRQVQLRLNFLGDVHPFTQLINIPEKAVNDPKLANELFTQWVEGNETVLTNALPVKWGKPQDLLPPPSEPARRRRRG
jgi:hypothetical protein